MPLMTPSRPSHPGVRNTPTSYYLPATITPNSTAIAVVANTVYYVPFNIAGRIDRIGIEVTVGSAGACRLALFANAGGIPTDLLVDAGTVDTTSLAVVEATIAARDLSDWIWAGCVFNATPTVRTGVSGSTASLGAASLSSTSRGLLAAMTYGAFAATAVVPTAFTSTVTPIVFLRKS